MHLLTGETPAQHISCIQRCFIPDPKSFPVPFSVQALPHVNNIHGALRIRQAQIEQSRSHHLLLTGALKSNKVPDTQYADPRWQLPGQKLRAMRYIGLAWLLPSFRSSATKDTALFSHARYVFAHAGVCCLAYLFRLSHSSRKGLLRRHQKQISWP